MPPAQAGRHAQPPAPAPAARQRALDEVEGEDDAWDDEDEEEDDWPPLMPTVSPEECWHHRVVAAPCASDPTWLCHDCGSRWPWNQPPYARVERVEHDWAEAERLASELSRSLSEQNENENGDETPEEQPAREQRLTCQHRAAYTTATDDDGQPRSGRWVCAECGLDFECHAPAEHQQHAWRGPGCVLCAAERRRQQMLDMEELVACRVPGCDRPATFGSLTERLCASHLAEIKLGCRLPPSACTHQRVEPVSGNAYCPEPDIWACADCGSTWTRRADIPADAVVDEVWPPRYRVAAA